MAENDKTGKFTNAITWIIMHVFMRGTVKRLNNMINEKDREEIIKLHMKAEEASKKFDELINKEKSKREIERKIESKKIQTNNWTKNSKIDESNEVCRKDDDKEEKIETIDRLLQKTIGENTSEGTKLEELKEKITYFLKAAILITKKQKCSANLLCNELKLNKNNAYYIINKLEEAGFIVDIYGKRNQDVLVENMEMLETLLTATDLNVLFGEDINEVEEE